MLTKGFPNYSFYPIACRCPSTVLFGDCQAEPRSIAVILPAKRSKKAVAAPGGLAKHAAIISFVKEPVALFESLASGA
jgi:hypothetical protein